MIRCATCRFFEKAYDPYDKKIVDDTGFCKVIKEVLKMDNSWMWDRDVKVRPTFGCSLYREAE
jgi:hypothetical protein